MEIDLFQAGARGLDRRDPGGYQDLQDGTLRLHFETKAWFSTMMIFTGSLWFYAVRFLPANRARSLLPCIAAHAAKNLGVFIIKYAQGYVSGWW